MKKDIQEGFVQVPGGKIWYKIMGANAGGTPLVVIHGGPGASHDYLLPLEALADERPVIFYDQLGCGNSDRPHETSLWTIERYVEELGILCKELHLTKYHLLGQSWGGTLAAEYTLSGNPEGVKSLILSAPLISSSRWIADQRVYVNQMPEEMRKIILKCEAGEDYANPEYQSAMTEFYNRHLCRIQPYPDPLSKTFEKTNSEIYNYMWGHSEFTVNGTCKDYDISGRLGEIMIPVLLTAGEFDEAAPDTMRYFAGLIPDSKVHIFENASHSHHLESKNEYIEVVRAFLRLNSH